MISVAQVIFHIDHVFNLCISGEDKLWEKQRELLSELGVEVGENWKDPDTLAQLEELHEQSQHDNDIYANQTMAAQERIMR